MTRTPLQNRRLFPGFELWQGEAMFRIVLLSGWLALPVLAATNPPAPARSSVPFTNRTESFLPRLSTPATATFRTPDGRTVRVPCEVEPSLDDLVKITTWANAELAWKAYSRAMTNDPNAYGVFLRREQARQRRDAMILNGQFYNPAYKSQVASLEKQITTLGTWLDKDRQRWQKRQSVNR